MLQNLMVMLLLVLLLTGADLFVIAEDTDDITDGESSRKILGQSVVTSVSVVMDIGNGTKTIYSDPLGRPVEKPSNPSDLASPINLLNPDRYEFYTFDDNGNLVRRLMSLQEIKGIIATGDSDGLEYDSSFSESYIPEKRVNDVLSNVQNVLKEEIEMHSTKLNTFPALDTPDVSDSWNMILPAVFGNSGADITPDKPPMHVTPDTIMIEPTENSQSSSRSTPSPTVPTSGFTHISSYFTPSIATATNSPSSKEPEKTTLLTTEFKEIDPITEFSTKEYIPISTFAQTKEDKTTTVIVEETPAESTTTVEYVKLEPITISSEITKPNENSTKTNTMVIVTEIPTTQKEEAPIVSSIKPEVIDDNKVTMVPELTIQSVEATVNCTSDKNEVLTTTSTSLIDDVNSIDKIAGPEILNQLLSTPLAQDIVKDTITNANTEHKESTTELKTETTANLKEATTLINEISTTVTNVQTVTVPLFILNSTTNYSIHPEETTFSILETDRTTISSTDKILPNLTESTTEVTEKTIPEEGSTTILSFTTDTVVSTEKIIKPTLELPSGGAPIRSTKVENVNETLPTTTDDEETVKSTPEIQTTEPISLTTILVPLTLIESSTTSIINQSNSTVRIPLMKPNESSKINITNEVPDVNIIINELQTKVEPVPTTVIYNESKNSSFESTTSSVEMFTDSTTEQYNATGISVTTTEKLQNKVPEQPYSMVQIPLTTSEKPSTTIKTDTTTNFVKITTTKNIEGTATTEKKDTNWTLVPTIAPHKGSTFESPPAIENYPELLEPSEPIDLKAEPLSGFGLEDSTSSLETDISQFTQLYNELAFEFWKSTTSTLSHARSVVLSPFGAISLLAMIFLGARGSTSTEMNEILKLDDMITFNPHLVLKDVGESIVPEDNRSGVVTSAIIRELFNDKGKGKLLPFYKERVRAFYDGYVEEVNFNEIGDIIRRRTNLQVKKQSYGKIVEFLTDTSLIGKAPLLGLSVNIFQTDCSGTFFDGRDGEMHFTVLPSIRQRRLVPIPATVYKSGFLAGYEASLDATVVAIGDKTKTVSTIFVMPGQQGTAVPGDGLARLEKSLVESSFKKGAWSRLLRSLIPRSGLEVQIPKIAHRSVINATHSLNQMGFVELFNKGKADLMGMNGVPNELYLSDLLQVNQFTMCGERRSDHHAEIYPSRSGRRLGFLQNEEHIARDLSESSFQDPLSDLSYLDLPLPLRPRQARKPDVSRLKFDRPFIYFVRHNPTGLILHIGRFNPRLLP